MSAPTANDKFHQMTEQFHCPDCEGLIDRAAVLVEFENSGMDVVRRIRASCDHCDKVWAARQVLVAGAWSFRDSVHEIQSTESRRQYERDLSKKRGRAA